MPGIPETIAILTERIRTLEDRLAQTGYEYKKIVSSAIKRAYNIQPQAETMFGLYTALCVDTVDPWKQNRVRFFSPLFNNPGTEVTALDWAYPISSMGGFDDCGLNWVPPAASTLCIAFENGSKSTPFYMGTTWHRNRGSEGNHNWGYTIKEFEDIHAGHRKGYLLGGNDEAQVFPQWNTESYNGIDLNSKHDFDNEPESSKKKITYPNIYGFKTPQKHMLKMVDGDYKCHHKHKRMEILSSNGNWMVFKDDHLHEFQVGGSSPPQSDDPDCKKAPKCGDAPVKKPSEYFKHQNEARPWNGPGTPQNNKCDLKQSGIQMLSVSGHTWLMDDSVEQPTDIPEWERSIKPFSFGCTDKYLGHMYFISATGHRLEFDDIESDTNVRGETNRIRLLTAAGHSIEMNDHYKDKKVSGSQRAITMRSTSGHVMELYDGEDLKQTSPERREGGVPVSKAKHAYVSLRSGYGLQILMEDSNSQEHTQSQAITIFSPQKDNKVRGPHIMRFQEVPSGPGQVALIVGGNYVIYTYDNHFTIVGDVKKNPSDKITSVSRNTLIDTHEFYLNMAETHLFDAKQYIILGAGQDCPIPGSKEKGPCFAPVLVLTDKGVVASDRVIASASPNAPCVSILQLLPFHDC